MVLPFPFYTVFFQLLLELSSFSFQLLSGTFLLLSGYKLFHFLSSVSCLTVLPLPFYFFQLLSGTFFFPVFNSLTIYNLSTLPNSFPGPFFFPLVNRPYISFLLFPTSFRYFSSSRWLTVLPYPFYCSNSFPGPFFFPVFNSPYISFLHCIFPTPSWTFFFQCFPFYCFQLLSGTFLLLSGY